MKESNKMGKGRKSMSLSMMFSVEDLITDSTSILKDSRHSSVRSRCRSRYNESNAVINRSPSREVCTALE